ncbi:hypothetical protein V8D89_000737 [Ganoderma adspersum]
MYVLAVLSVAVLAGQTAATPVASAAPLVEAILKRQGGTTLDPGSIPAQCESQCGAVINAINTCTDITCLCSDAVNKGMYDCFECGLSLQPDASLLSSAQKSLTQFENTCNAAGIPGVQLTSLTLTMPTGTAAASSSTSSGLSTAASNPSTAVTTNLAGTTTIVNTVLPAPTTAVTTAQAAATSPLNPLSRNGAGMVGVSLASVVGVVGVAVAALF